jgi:hypothetical protein
MVNPCLCAAFVSCLAPGRLQAQHISLYEPPPDAFLSCRLVGLPSSTTFDDLLGKAAAAAAAKKGAMKTGAGAASGASDSRMGQVKQVTAHHLADGQTLLLQVQVRYITRLVYRDTGTWLTQDC